MALYSPFMAQGGANLGNAIADRGQNRMAGDAYMSKPGAMEKLMQFNPKMGMEITQQKQVAEQKKLDKAAKTQKDLSAMLAKKREVFSAEVEKAAKLGTPEEFVSHLENFRESLRPEFGDVVDSIPDPTAEMYEQTKQMHGDDPKSKYSSIKQGVGPDGKEVFIGLNKDTDKYEVIEGGTPKPSKGMKITTTDGTTIETGVSTGGLSKPTKTSLQKDIIENQTSMDSINQLEALYEPEFLTYGGLAKGKLATVMNKMDPEDRSNFQTRRSAFIGAANQNFLAFRKWATGVSGGEKEMAEIKRATFSEDDSPQDFEAKLGLIKSLKRRLNARMKAALSSGVDNQEQFKEYLKDHSLDGIPTLQERGEALQKLGYDKTKIKTILSQEGYM